MKVIPGRTGRPSRNRRGKDRLRYLDLVAQYRNIISHPRVALVIGWDEEVTLSARVWPTCRWARIWSAAQPPTSSSSLSAASAYLKHVRVRPGWLRYSDYRPDS